MSFLDENDNGIIDADKAGKALCQPMNMTLFLLKAVVRVGLL